MPRKTINAAPPPTVAAVMKMDEIKHGITKLFVPNKYPKKSAALNVINNNSARVK